MTYYLFILLKEAKNVDKILDSNNIPEEFNINNAPLLGVPFSTKECFWVKGIHFFYKTTKNKQSILQRHAMRHWTCRKKRFPCT